MVGWPVSDNDHWRGINVTPTCDDNFLCQPACKILWLVRSIQSKDLALAVGAVSSKVYPLSHNNDGIEECPRRH